MRLDYETTSSPGHRTQPAVFLDRDGTLIEDNGSLRSPAQVVFYAATVPALRRLQEHFRLFIVTNQSGVAKGELTLDEVNRVNAHVIGWLRECGIHITAVYVCPHERSEGCACIKPNRHFADQAAREHRVDLARSFAVGDHPHDVEFGCSFNGTGIYVLTGHGVKHRSELRGDEAVAADIGAAVDWILARPEKLARLTCNQHEPETSCAS